MSSKVINELTLKINADIAELKGALGQAKTEVSGFQSKMKNIHIIAYTRIIINNPL